MKKNIIITLLLILVVSLSITTYIELNKINELEKSYEKQSIEELKREVKEATQVDNKEDIIEEYVTVKEQEIDKILVKETPSASEEKTLKSYFITLTDFIFYDGEIKGKKFSELTEEIKLKVINLYEKIDSKIEEKYPNYKETIKSNGIKTYNNVKDKLSEVKETVLNKYKEEVSEEKYNNTLKIYEEDKANLKEVYEGYKPYVERGIETGKEKSKNLYEKAKESLSNWYQEYKNS